AAKALWHEWMRVYWPRIHPVIRAPFLAVGLSARTLWRAGQQMGRTVYIGARDGFEEGGHRDEEWVEVRNQLEGTVGWRQALSRIRANRATRAKSYQEHGEQVHGAAVQLREEKAEWARASTLGELGEVTARWAEGKVKYNPDGYDEGPADET